MTGQVRTTRGSPAAAWLLALLIAAPAAPAAVAGARATRSIEVSRPGLVKLSLELDDVLEMEPGGRDLRLFSPTGEELPYRHLFELTEERRTPVLLQAVEQRPEGWRIRLDAGSDPAAHQALLFEMAESALAPGVRLEGSADGESWRLLAESDLFRVGGESEMRGAMLSYEPTTDRFLRLDWPLEAGFPEAEKIDLERGPASPVQRRLTEPGCRSPNVGTTVCRLRSEAPLARRLALEIRGQGPVAFRLTQAMNGTWQPVSEGVWRLEAGAARHRLPRIPSLERPADLRTAGRYRGPPTPQRRRLGERRRRSRPRRWRRATPCQRCLSRVAGGCWRPRPCPAPWPG